MKKWIWIRIYQRMRIFQNTILKFLTQYSPEHKSERELLKLLILFFDRFEGLMDLIWFSNQSNFVHQLTTNFLLTDMLFCFIGCFMFYSSVWIMYFSPVFWNIPIITFFIIFHIFYLYIFIFIRKLIECINNTYISFSLHIIDSPW